MSRATKLPVHPRTLVLELLRKSAVPVTAYGLLEQLQGKGIKSAPIIYRALAELEKQGLVHKIQAVGAYVACSCSADHTHAFSIITICSDCKQVDELHDHTIIHHLEKLKQMQVNLRPAAVIELPITCERCAA